tara:strand:- start:2341 stop:2622 length:282 start_codon:yes stop_codon:yes gene_type:complete
MDLKNYFETATEKFEFTVNLGGWKGKKVFEFSPKDKESWSSAAVRELSLFGKSMNVSSITKQGLMMYDFSMLGNKQTAKIKWENVELGNTLDK